MAGCNETPVVKNYIPTTADSVQQEQVFARSRLAVKKIKDSITSGDIVTRTGNDFTSESLRHLNQRDKTFSHCGIASIENDTVFIYHALGGEFNPDQKIRRDPLEMFTDPSGNKGMGIFRFQLTDSIKRSFATMARSWYNRGVPFDMDFNLETDDRVYCAEFLYKVIRSATGGSIDFNRSHIQSFEFVGVDDIFLHPLCQLRYAITYK